MLVDFRGDPHLEIVVDILSVGNCLNDLVTELYGEVTVLQHDPLTLLHALAHHPPGRLLLPLPHGKLLVRLSDVLGQGLDLVGRVGAGGKKAEEGSPVVRLIDHPLQVEDDVLQEGGSQGVVDILPGLGQSPVRTPGSDQQELSEHVQRVLISTGNLLLCQIPSDHYTAIITHLLWGLSVAPILPVLLRVDDLLQENAELVNFAHLHQVQPNHVQHPSVGFGLKG